MERPRIATVWMGGCSGCHMSFLDLDEFLIEFASKVELVFSPVLDVKEYPDGVDVALIEGAVCNEDHLELAHKIRARTKIVVAFGDCAVTGNVSAMRNPLGNPKSALQLAYIESAQTTPAIPQLRGIVPTLLDRVMPMHEVIPVEFYLPGCPPPASRIRAVIEQLVAGQTPHLEGTDLKFG